jgi:hypothetical protein
MNTFASVSITQMGTTGVPKKDTLHEDQRLTSMEEGTPRKRVSRGMEGT